MRNSGPPTAARLERLRKLLDNFRLDLLLVTKPANVSYLSGFSGDDSFLLVSRKEKFFITDSRYIEQAKDEAAGYKIIEYSAGVEAAFARLIKKLGAKRIGVEKNISLKNYESLKSYLPGADIMALDSPVEQLRKIKDRWEISRIKEASRIALLALSDIRKYIRPGITERTLAGRLEFAMRARGAERSSFEIIAAFGRSSSMPHARPRTSRIRANGHLLIDFGARIRRYNCDLTRVFFLGKIDRKVRRIYDVVKAAQQQALDVIRPGLPIREVDRAARDFIAKCGFNQFFGHATGHGIGLEVHEMPSVSSRNQEILKEGMVFSVEPGIYLPGIGGVRIEDTVLVSARGREILTR